MSNATRKVRIVRDGPEPPAPRAEDELEALDPEAPPEAPDAEETSYRRRRAPVPVRRKRSRDWAQMLRRGWRPSLAAALALLVAFALYSLVFRSSWFLLEGSGQIAITGAHQTDGQRVLAVFSADLGRNLFFIPLSQRRRAVERIPWVRQAAVLRLWPARLEVKIQERTPVAYARVGSHLDLIDAQGVLLERPAKANFDFPVLTGLAGISAVNPNASEWLDQRQPQVARWSALQQAVAPLGHHAAFAISEVNLRNPGDLRARVSLGAGSSVLVDLGNRNFEPRFQLFLSQIASWRQKYPNMVSVDLHFDGQAIVDPGPTAAPAPAASTKPSRGEQR
ncbi:MAG: FtsQ-type POTRA domain-containing protein [Acidobacteria bacterium]|nr:MAG: FtsQ-type POTRA domain-containing protein [Acidobacteriota bacterium]